MSDRTRLIISETLRKTKMSIYAATKHMSKPNLQIEADSAANELVAYVIGLEDRAVRAESEVTHLNSGIYNRFRTWVGCAFARHYAQMEDISFMLGNSQPIAKEL
jgi:hypothetical protein